MKPCRKCGATDRYTRTDRLGDCRPCAKRKGRERYPRIKEARATYFRQWYTKNPGHVSDHATASRLGMSRKDLLAFVASRPGHCEICGTTEPGRGNRRMSVDHAHDATGALRGLLCHSCNLLLGHAKDDVGRLRAAIDYLERTWTRHAC